MVSVNIWRQCALYGKKIIILIALVLFMYHTQAQDASFSKDRSWIDKNLPYYDDRLIHYGFTLGLNTTRFIPTESNYYLNPKDSVTSITAPYNAGFSLGFIFNLKLAEFFDLRALPTVSFYQRDVDYKLGTKSSSVQSTESTFLELPLLVKYKSQRHGNSRMYVVGGIKPGIEAGAKKKEKKDTDLRTNNKDLSIDYGFGFDIYYPLFKFSPEVRFSHGLSNMLNHDNNPYALSLKKIVTHTVTLYLHFE
jgi:hypothetical protein